MITYWLPLMVGLSLGLLPPRLLLNGGCRYLTFDELWTKVIHPEQQNQKRRRWWKLPLVWIDPFRGYVVARYLLDAFEPELGATAFQRLLPTLSSGALILLCLWVQTRGRPGERETLTPAGFLAGVMIAMLPPTVAIAGIVMGAATALAIQGYSAGHFVAAVTTAGIGFVFMNRSPTLAITTVLIAFPMTINWFRNTKLVMPVRC